MVTYVPLLLLNISRHRADAEPGALQSSYCQPGFKFFISLRLDLKRPCGDSFLCVFVLSYVISTLELMVAEDYMIVYLNGATPHRRMPGLGWLKKCYQMIDRRPVPTYLHPFPDKILSAEITA